MWTKMRQIRASLLFLVCLACACGPNEGVLKAGKSNAVPAADAPKTPIEQELAAMRTAGFNYVYVLRRKDGAKIDAEDRSVIRMNTGEANRRVSSDEDKAFIIGSNPAIPPKNLAAIYERFAVENYSPPPPANVNTNNNSGK